MIYEGAQALSELLASNSTLTKLSLADWKNTHTQKKILNLMNMNRKRSWSKRNRNDK